MDFELKILLFCFRKIFYIPKIIIDILLKNLNFRLIINNYQNELLIDIIFFKNNCILEIYWLQT
ncbi:hypothetical protein BpHYR1_029522 [Brachionus plicatilis]|uniref:Uncharacterized protein n=1 Tax=Brachionus plicatilis TaxID=10195 RepID=A0A3M7R657_BRAPC|nr:hypothetical protein BpHYR1_029522 [Brachionus plicatilis]